MVEYHIQHNLDAVAVQVFNQGFKLVYLHPQPPGRREPGLGGEEAYLAVTPVVVKRFAGHWTGFAVLELVKLKDRHQFDAVHAQLLEIRNLLADSGEGAAMLYTRRSMLGKAANVHFVD